MACRLLCASRHTRSLLMTAGHFGTLSCRSYPAPRSISAPRSKVASALPVLQSRSFFSEWIKNLTEWQNSRQQAQALRQRIAELKQKKEAEELASARAEQEQVKEEQQESIAAMSRKHRLFEQHIETLRKRRMGIDPALDFIAAEEAKAREEAKKKEAEATKEVETFEIVEKVAAGTPTAGAAGAAGGERVAQPAAGFFNTIKDDMRITPYTPKFERRKQHKMPEFELDPKAFQYLGWTVDERTGDHQTSQAAPRSDQPVNFTRKVVDFASSLGWWVGNFLGYKYRAHTLEGLEKRIQEDIPGFNIRLWHTVMRRMQLRWIIGAFMNLDMYIMRRVVSEQMLLRLLVMQRVMTERGVVPVFHMTRLRVFRIFKYVMLPDVDDPTNLPTAEIWTYTLCMGMLKIYNSDMLKLRGRNRRRYMKRYRFLIRWRVEDGMLKIFSIRRLRKKKKRLYGKNIRSFYRAFSKLKKYLDPKTRQNVKSPPSF